MYCMRTDLHVSQVGTRWSNCSTSLSLWFAVGEVLCTPDVQRKITSPRLVSQARGSL